MKLEDLFPEINDFTHKAIFDGIRNTWDVIPKINPYIAENLPADEGSLSLPKGLEEVRGEEGYAMLYCDEPLTLTFEFIYQPFSIHIGAGTTIEPSAIIKGPALIGHNCQIRQGAYLRGNIIVGDKCILGHATEIKDSIIMNDCAAAHFNYIGDSVLGSYVNLGAGTKLANLKLRTIEYKKKEAFPEVTFYHNKNLIKTGLKKLGAILGDYCETGCNAVTSPAVIMGKNSWIYPNVTVPSGYYPDNSFIYPEPRKPKVGKRPGA